MSTNKELLITKEVSENLGLLFQLLKERIDNSLIGKKFVLQCLLILWYENRGFLPDKLFIESLNNALITGNEAEIFSNLSQQLNNLQIKGFLAIIYPFILTISELQLLKICSDFDWNYVNFTIFGNLFEQAIAPISRHKYGIHFTTEADIMKIVRPTISKYWESKIESANNLKELNQLQLELANYKVLDPACGSGNFLYVAYQELKRIEQILLDKISANKRQKLISFVTPNQFFGMDINPFAVELAKVTLMIAKKVAIDRYNLTESPLPLDSLDNNIICQDALFSDWIKANAIIGNPPFLGGKKLRQELGNEYVDKLNQLYPEVKGQPDFCTFWFRKAIDNIDEKGRVGLVGTNSIAQNVSRQASLDYIVEKGGFIYNAISTQIWSGEANVHVSIVNWSKEKTQDLFLNDLSVQTISTSLKNAVAVNLAKRLKSNLNSSFESCALSGKGFIISEEEALEWIKKDPKNKEVLKPMLDGQSLINLWAKKDWVIDFNDFSIEKVANYELPFQRVKEKVKPERDRNKEKLRREN
jgi:type II restriction/modification system DNA methylase subunit YeeA